MKQLSISHKSFSKKKKNQFVNLSPLGFRTAVERRYTKRHDFTGNVKLDHRTNRYQLPSTGTFNQMSSKCEKQQLTRKEGQP